MIALQGILGVAIGALLRNTAAAVGATLVWAFIIEGILPVVINQPHLTNWLPSGAIREITSSHTPPGQLVPVVAAPSDALGEFVWRRYRSPAAQAPVGLGKEATPSRYVDGLIAAASAVRASSTIR
jgi:hypothetical protein